ncbi:MAG: glycerol-3-phosphate acyltransferase [Candidatus Paceibacterota bacterium]
MIFNLIAIALISYILGSIPFSLVFVKLFTKKNLHELGSKNAGALNTLRIVAKEKGKVWGVLSFLLVGILDASKGVFAVLIAKSYFFPILLQTSAEITMPWPTIVAIIAFFAVLGHNYSIFLKFKGGRGAATLFGILLYLNVTAALGILGFVLLFIFLGELLAGHKLNKKFVSAAISNQIIGRLLGEIVGLFWMYTIDPMVFYIAALPIVLIVFAHKDRLDEQIKKIKDKTYLKD